MMLPGLPLPEELGGGEPAQFFRPIPIDLAEFNWGTYYMRPVVRLKEGASPARALAKISAVLAALRRENPPAGIDAPDYSLRVVQMQDDLVGEVRTALWVLLGAAAVVLLIACANVASLLGRWPWRRLGSTASWPTPSGCVRARSA